MVNKNDIAASMEQDRQDNIKPLWLHGVDNLPGFVAKKKNTEKNEAYYTKIILNALEDVEDELIYGDDELERDLHELKTKLISGKMALVEDTDMQPGDDIGYNEQDGIAGNLCSIRKKEETVAVEKEEELTSETHNHKLEKETKLILKAVDGYRMLLFTMPSNGVYDANLVAELGKLFEDLSDGDIILSKNTSTGTEIEMDVEIDARAGMVDGLASEKLEKETRLIKELLHSYKLLYSNNLSEKRANELRELSKKLFSEDIILVKNPEKVSYIGEEISAEIGGDIKKIQDKDKAAKDIEWKEYQDWLVCRANFEWKKYQDSLSCEKKTEEPASETVRKSTYSAFWKRLRHLKSRRKRKSIVKVITETTIEEFETQLTKHANNGYKIKYVNINTKAGNSGTGVRYYAVVQRY